MRDFTELLDAHNWANRLPASAKPKREIDGHAWLAEAWQYQIDQGNCTEADIPVIPLLGT